MRRAIGVLGVLLVAGLALAKSKSLLPGYVLQAHTITVLIDPEAGISADDPQANRVAQKDVEAALQTWGRFSYVMGTQSADLIVVVRRGHREVDETIRDPRQNNRPGDITSTDSATTIGAQHGRPPDQAGTQGLGKQTAGPQMEIGSSDDLFTVYRGDVKDPLQGVPTWRYAAKDALHPHTVPAVAEFKKAVAETEKAAGKKP